MVCVILFLIGLIVMKVDKNNGKIIHNFLYEHNFNFATANKIYQKYFGKILPIDKIIPEGTTPVFTENIKYKEASIYKEGVKLTVDKEYLIPILESGVVIFIGDKEEYGKTIIIQQVNGIDVWYSNIDNISVNLYDYVTKGEFLAQAKDTTLYLVFQKQGVFLDYKDHI